MLALLLSFNSVICYVHAEDFNGSSTDYGTPSNAKPITDSPEYEKVQKNIDTVMKAFFTAIRPECERGSNENANKLIRRWIPKGAHISDFTDQYIKDLQDWINNYPRKIFDYLSANEYKALVA